MQHSWSKDFKHCAGKRQSPIAIKSSYCVSLPLPALEMNGYHDYLPRPNGLMNSGHSGQSCRIFNIIFCIFILYR